MSKSNQPNVSTHAPNEVATPDASRFAKFDHSELAIISDAFRELLDAQQKAMEILNADLGSDPEDSYTEQDFRIPGIAHLLAEVEPLL
jgi:hypothetical protein